MPKLYFGVPTFNLCDTQCCKEFDVIIVLMEWLRFRVWSGTSATQNSGRSKWTQYSIGIVLPVRFEPGILYLQIYHVFFKSNLEKNGQFIERYTFVSGLWSEKSEVQISGRLNPTQYYQRLATVVESRTLKKKQSESTRLSDFPILILCVLFESFRKT